MEALLTLQKIFIFSRPVSRYPKRICFILFLAIVLSNFIPLDCSAQNPSDVKQKIVFGGDRDYPPYEFLDDKNHPRGFHVDLINAIGKVEGFEVEVQLKTWARALSAFKEGRTDVLAMFYSKERDQYVDFAEPHTIIYHDSRVPSSHHFSLL